MLTFDPMKRVTVEEALGHPYLSALHFPEDEPSADVVPGFDFDFELYDLRKEDYKEMIYGEIMLYHSEEILEEYIANKAKFPDGMLKARFGDKQKKSPEEE
jgi:hypothetical protein